MIWFIDKGDSSSIGGSSTESYGSSITAHQKNKTVIPNLHDRAYNVYWKGWQYRECLQVRFYPLRGVKRKK